MILNIPYFKSYAMGVEYSITCRDFDNTLNPCRQKDNDQAKKSFNRFLDNIVPTWGYFADHSFW